MKLPDSNPQWRYGYKFMAMKEKNAVGIGIRNGKRMITLFMSPDEAKQLAQELIKEAEHE